MRISEIIQTLEAVAPTALQENYDNAGLITGRADWDCTGVLCTLDVTEDVVREAIENGCNCIVAHHPVVFRGLKRITGKTYVERTVIAAIKNDIAIYAIHTNLDNVAAGVSGVISDKLGLTNRRILSVSPGTLKKLFTFVPHDHLEVVRNAIFAAGAGKIGNYSECSYSVGGQGTFKAETGADPFVGKVGTRHEEAEYKIEMVFPSYLQQSVIDALIKAHPYETPAFDIVDLANEHPETGAGMVGELEKPLDSQEFLRLLKERFDLQVVRHTEPAGTKVKRVAVCGGAGSFLISKALSVSADVYISADIKYHEFFDAEGKMMICDIGHYESEQFTVDLLYDLLVRKFPTFAVLKSKVRTNPVHYFLG
jgi:dinuclear metal center YbgI/SA1388 family protein